MFSFFCAKRETVGAYNLAVNMIISWDPRQDRTFSYSTIGTRVYCHFRPSFAKFEGFNVNSNLCGQTLFTCYQSVLHGRTKVNLAYLKSLIILFYALCLYPT